MQQVQIVDRFGIIAEHHVPHIYPFAHEYLPEGSILIGDLAGQPRIFTTESIYLALRDKAYGSQLINNRLRQINSAVGSVNYISETLRLDIMGIFYLFGKEEFADLSIGDLKNIFFCVGSLDRELQKWLKKFFVNEDNPTFWEQFSREE